MSDRRFLVIAVTVVALIDALAWNIAFRLTPERLTDHIGAVVTANLVTCAVNLSLAFLALVGSLVTMARKRS